MTKFARPSLQNWPKPSTNWNKVDRVLAVNIFKVAADVWARFTSL